MTIPAIGCGVPTSPPLVSGDSTHRTPSRRYVVSAARSMRRARTKSGRSSDRRAATEPPSVGGAGHRPRVESEPFGTVQFGDDALASWSAFGAQRDCFAGSSKCVRA